MREKFLLDADAMSLGFATTDFCSDSQLGIFIKKISRINCYLTGGSARALNSSKRNHVLKIFLREEEILSAVDSDARSVRNPHAIIRAIQNNRLKSF